MNWHGQSTRNDYEFGLISVGETRTYPWYVDDEGLPDVRKNRNRYKAFVIFKHRTGRKFRFECPARGFVVTRIE